MNLLIVDPGPNMLVIVDHAGTRAFGELRGHDREALQRWDVWLDSLDAANEDAQGRLR